MGELNALLALMNDISGPTLKALNEVLGRLLIAAEPIIEVTQRIEKRQERALEILAILAKCRSIHQAIIGTNEQKMGRVKQYLKETTRTISERHRGEELTLSSRRLDSRQISRVIHNRRQRRNGTKAHGLGYIPDSYNNDIWISGYVAITTPNLDSVYLTSSARFAMGYM